MVLSEMTVTFLCAEGISHFGPWHQILLQLTAFPSPHSAEQEMWREKQWRTGITQSGECAVPREPQALLQRQGSARDSS